MVLALIGQFELRHQFQSNRCLTININKICTYNTKKKVKNVINKAFMDLETSFNFITINSKIYSKYVANGHAKNDRYIN